MLTAAVEEFEDLVLLNRAFSQLLESMLFSMGHDDMKHSFPQGISIGIDEVLIFSVTHVHEHQSTVFPISTF